VRGGSAVYYRDGVEYPSGFFLGGAGDAVKGNPRAEDEARTAHHLMIGGISCELASFGALGAGLGIASQNQPSDTAKDAAVGLLLGAVVVNVVGAILINNAVPHVVDAINIYNDGLPPYSGPGWPGPPPPPPVTPVPKPAAP
jgi:hypothetical protein